MASITELCSPYRYTPLGYSAYDYLNLTPLYPRSVDIAYPYSDDLAAILALVKGGKDLFENPLSAAFICQNELVQGALDTITFISPTGSFTQDIKTQIIDVLNSSVVGVNHFSDHINFNIISPLNNEPGFLPTIMSGVNVGATSNPAAMNLPNACQQLGGVFGSILGDGAGLTQTLSDALNPLLSAIGDGLSSLQQLVGSALSAVLGPIQNALSAISDLISNEIANIASLIQSVADFARSTGLFGFLSNPCAQALFNAAGSNSLLTTVPGITRFT